MKVVSPQPSSSKIWLLLAFLSLPSCSGIDMARLQAHLTESNCKQQHVYPYTTRDIPKPIHYFYHPALTARFSFNSLNVANAINIWVGLESIWTA